MLMPLQGTQFVHRDAHVVQPHQSLFERDAGRDGIAQTLRLLENFLQHVMGEAALVCHRVSSVPVGYGFRYGSRERLRRDHRVRLRRWGSARQNRLELPASACPGSPIRRPAPDSGWQDGAPVADPSEQTASRCEPRDPWSTRCPPISRPQATAILHFDFECSQAIASRRACRWPQIASVISTAASAPLAFRNSSTIAGSR